MCQRGRQIQFMDNGNAGRRVIYLRARVYTKKFSSNTLREHVRVPQIGIFPHNRVYTEKMIFQIHFFAISGVQTEDFSTYTLFPLQNRAKREDIADKRGTAEQLFSIYPAASGIVVQFRCLRKVVPRIQKFPVNCEVHLTESIFQPCFGPKINDNQSQRW